jgi:hypothetical protein
MLLGKKRTNANSKLIIFVRVKAIMFQVCLQEEDALGDDVAKTDMFFRSGEHKVKHMSYAFYATTPTKRANPAINDVVLS